VVRTLKAGRRQNAAVPARLVYVRNGDLVAGFLWTSGGCASTASRWTIVRPPATTGLAVSSAAGWVIGLFGVPILAWLLALRQHLDLR